MGTKGIGDDAGAAAAWDAVVASTLISTRLFASDMPRLNREVLPDHEGRSEH